MKRRIIRRRPVHERTVIKCREVEQMQIERWIADRLSAKCSSALHICGPPGTGKTFVLKTIVDQLGEKTVYINCMQLNGKSLLNHLSDVLEARPDKLLERLGRRRCLLVIDEIDQILNTVKHSRKEISEDEAILMKILKIALSSKQKLALIGVSNALIDLSLRFYANTGIEKIKTHLKSISFSPYSRDDINDIISANIGGLDKHDRKSLLICSARISNSTGDARLAIELARRACDSAEGGGRNENARDIIRDENVSHGIVLSYVQKLILRCLIDMVSSTPGKLVVAKVEECFAYFSKNQFITDLKRIEYDGVLVCMADLGLISLERFVRNNRSFGLSTSNSSRKSSVSGDTMVVKLSKHPDDLRLFLNDLQ